MPSEAEEFVRDWLGQNVHNLPEVDDWTEPMAAKAEQLKDAASQAGIKYEAFSNVVGGDACEFVMAYYASIYDPDEGFYWRRKKSSSL